MSKTTMDKLRGFEEVLQVQREEYAEVATGRLLVLVSIIQQFYNQPVYLSINQYQTSLVIGEEATEVGQWSPDEKNPRYDLLTSVIKEIEEIDTFISDVWKITLADDIVPFNHGANVWRNFCRCKRISREQRAQIRAAHSVNN